MGRSMAISELHCNKHKVARSVLTKTLLGKRNLDTHQGYQCALRKDGDHKILEYANNMMTMALAPI